MNCPICGAEVDLALVVPDDETGVLADIARREWQRAEERALLREAENGDVLQRPDIGAEYGPDPDGYGTSA